MTAPKRPNIVFITTDQQRADCYGFENPQVRTPNIDAVVAGGTRFRNCITPSAVCQPARASILTGSLPLTHGAWDNGVDLPQASGDQGFARHLVDRGYATAFVGKAHFSSKVTYAPTGRPECQHSWGEYPEDWSGPYMGFEHVELAVLGKFHRARPQEPPPLGQHFERWFFSHPDAMALWGASDGPDTGAAQTWNSKLPAAWHCTEWTTQRAIAALDARRGSDKPFCLWVSYADPHHPFDCPTPWNRLYDPKDIVLPRHRTKDLDRRPRWHEAALNAQPAIKDPALAKFRKQGFNVPDQTDEQLAHMMANYYGMISFVDDGVGRIRSHLRELGLDGDTFFIVASDHGDYLGDHGLYLKGPMMYEGVLRVALAMEGPGIAAGQVIKQPVSTMDLAATFLDWAGGAMPEGCPSRSLLPVMAGRETREAAYSEWRVHPARLGFALDLRVVRTERYKCTMEYASGEGEMYDLQEDPYELVNRFDDPAYAGVRREMLDRLNERPGGFRAQLDEPVGIA